MYKRWSFAARAMYFDSARRPIIHASQNINREEYPSISERALAATSNTTDRDTDLLSWSYGDGEVNRPYSTSCIFIIKH